MNLNFISDQIADAANEALTEAIENAALSSYDINTDAIEAIIEEAVEDRLQEAVEAALKERESESAFTFRELFTMRQGVHKLKMLQYDIDEGKQEAYREFGVEIDTAKFNAWVGKEADRLKELYNKIDKHMDNVNARGE